MTCFRGDPVESNIMNDITLRIIMAAKAVMQVLARGGGQLKRNTFLGEKIYQLARIEDFKTFVEIGTWNGQGSTKCFMDALLFRHDDSYLCSVESNKDFHEMAKKYWRPVLFTSRGKEKVRFIYGRLIEISELLPCDEISGENGADLANYQRWRDEDIFDYGESPNVIGTLPNRIDVLLLDGGEFSTYAEYQKLRERTGVVLLDDTKALKCKKVREELLNDKTWRIIYDLPEENNGSLIACRQGYYDYLKDRI